MPWREAGRQFSGWMHCASTRTTTARSPSKWLYQQPKTVLIFLGMPRANSYFFFDFLDRDAALASIREDTFEEAIAACGMDKIAVMGSFVHFCYWEWWTRACGSCRSTT